ncbi:MAG: hypothetical protein DCC67_01860 [Planctomycetota bacterium]|nr:MAG: hypothetical protein DCC67_01860 [Planctomycetota bacterium]
MMHKLVFSVAVTWGIVASARAATVTNPWSGVAGDRANIMGFAFRADAGNYPASIDPAGSLRPHIQLTKVTLVRPASSDPTNPTTPSFGTGPRQTTSAATPVFLEVYAAADSATDSFSGFLGASTNSIAWQDMPLEGEGYSFDFANLPLQSNSKYWFAFSEDNVDGEFSNFRLRVNTSGNDATAGPGQGYLVSDAFQILDQGGNSRDWAAEYVVEFTSVPEPSGAALALAAVGLTAATRSRSRR